MIKSEAPNQFRHTQTEIVMRELEIPSEVKKDENATEMVRFWLANNEPNVSLLLGMWEDAEDSGIDELTAWGNVLSDIAQHIANGMEQSHGWKYEQTMHILMEKFIQCAKDRAPGLDGEYTE